MRLFPNSLRKFFQGDNPGGQSFMWNPLNPFQGRNKQQLLGQYKNLVYSCVSTIAEDVARYDPCFYYEMPDDQDQKIENHPFDLVLQNPNPSMSEYELYEATQSLIELTGECFWYITLGQYSREPKAIDIMRPDRVKLAINETSGAVEGYIFVRPDGTEIPLELDEVIHFKMYNPLNKYRGLGTVEAGLLYIETETETSEFQRNFMKNQASPSGVLSFKGNIAKPAFDKVKKVWKDQQSGTVNAGKTLFIRETDVDFTKIGLSIADLDMSALKKITQDEVRGMFRIPKIMLGEVEGTGLGRDVAETAEYIYQKRTIEPKLIRLDDSIAKYCRMVYKDPKLQIEHESTIPQDRSKLIAEIKELTGLVYTQDESRRMLDMPELGSTDLYVPFNWTPVLSTPEPVTAKGTMRVVRHIQKALPQIEKSSPEDNYIEQTDNIGMTAEEAYIAKLVPQIAKQEKGVMAHVQSKTIDSITNWVSEGKSFINVEVDTQRFLDAVLPSLVNGIDESGQLTFAYLDAPSEEFVLEQATRDALINSERVILKDFNIQTSERINKVLSMGLEKGENIQQLADRVQEVMDVCSDSRAKGIARSESNRAVVAGQEEAMRQQGIRQKRWVTEADPCPICKGLSGTIIDIGEAFISKGSTIPGTDIVNDYDDITGGDAHTNCRCKLVPIKGKTAGAKIVTVDRYIEPDETVVKELEELKEYAHQLELIAGIDGTIDET